MTGILLYFLCLAETHARIAQVDRRAEADYHIDASPASCVNLAVYELVPDVDLVISGPNIGHNAGRCAGTNSFVQVKVSCHDCHD